MKKLFRRASIERLTSPEQLDRLLVITRFPGWIALLFLIILIFALLLWSFFGKIPVTVEGNGIFFDPRAILVIQNDSEGTVDRIYAHQGDPVKKGDPLLSLKNSSSEFIIRAPEEGLVLSIQVPIGERVSAGTTLAWMEKTRASEERDLVFAYFPITTASQIQPRMRAQIDFEGVKTELYGKIEGRVQQILPFATEGYILQSIPSKELRNFLTQEETTLLVVIRPKSDPKTISGYTWTQGEGPPYPIQRGTVAKVNVFLEERRPITYLIKS